MIHKITIDMKDDTYKAWSKLRDRLHLNDTQMFLYTMAMFGSKLGESNG